MLINDIEYFKILEDIKTRIRAAQYRAIMGANREQIVVNWNIGKTIIVKSQWGNKFIDNLARDIKLEFPGIKGYSLIIWQETSSWNSRVLKDTRCGISSICASSQSSLMILKLCRECLHNLAGRITRL